MTHIKQRGDTASNWAFHNPVLMEREVGWETDTRKSKLGDGVTGWNALPYTTVDIPVRSVNTQTGDVFLTKVDLGLGNVNNTSDLAKPVSTATQAALAAKADSAALASKADKDSPALTGNPTAPTPVPGDISGSLATTEFVMDAVASAAPPTIPGAHVSRHSGHAQFTVTPADTNMLLPMMGEIVSSSGGMTLTNGGLYVPKTGWYSVTAAITFAASTSSARRSAWINVTSNPTVLYSTRAAGAIASAQPTALSTTINLGINTYVEAGNYITVFVSTGTPWALNQSGQANNTLSAVYLGA